MQVLLNMTNHFLLLRNKFILFGFLCFPILSVAQSEVKITGTVTGLNGGNVFIGFIEDAATKFLSINTGKATAQIIGEGLRKNTKRLPLQNGKFSTTLLANEDDLVLLIFYKEGKESEPQFIVPNTENIALLVEISAWDDRITAYKTKLTSKQGCGLSDFSLLEEKMPADLGSEEAKFWWRYENIQNKESFWAMLLTGSGNGDNFFEGMNINQDSLLAISEDKPFKKAYESVLTYKKPTLVDGVLPDFQAIDPEGNAFKLSDYRGKYVLLEVWASWCGDCRKEHPDIEKLYQKYKEKGFEVVGISNDEEAEWREALEKDKQSWKQGYKAEMLYAEDQTIENPAVILSALERRLGVEAFPTLILLNPEGKIIYRGYEYVLPEIETKLASLLN